MADLKHGGDPYTIQRILMNEAIVGSLGRELWGLVARP